jgi:hypothetical protein
MPKEKERMVSIRVQVPETLRSEFMRLCLDHKPRLSMNATLEAVIAGLVAGRVKLPLEASDKRLSQRPRK